MSITYRAAYIGDCVMTSFAQSLLPDAGLKAAALALAHEVSSAAPAYDTESEFLSNLQIGEWTEKGTADLAVYDATASGVLERGVVDGWDGSVQNYLDYRELTARETVQLTGWPEARAIDCGRVLVAPLFAE